MQMSFAQSSWFPERTCSWLKKILAKGPGNKGTLPCSCLLWEWCCHPHYPVGSHPEFLVNKGNWQSSAHTLDQTAQSSRGDKATFPAAPPRATHQKPNRAILWAVRVGNASFSPGVIRDCKQDWPDVSVLNSSPMPPAQRSCLRRVWSFLAEERDATSQLQNFPWNTGGSGNTSPSPGMITGWPGLIALGTGASRYPRRGQPHL